MTLFRSFYELDGTTDFSEGVGGSAGVGANVLRPEAGNVELGAKSLRQNLAVQ